MPIYELTRTGRELMQLGSFEDNEDYLRAVAERIKPQGFEVQLASYITISRDKRQYFNLQPV